MLGYTRGAWATPIRVYTPPAPPLTTTPVAPVVTQQAPRPTSIPFYDPSRIFKDIKVVSDLRQSGTERGEVQTGDDGFLGPGSIAPPQEGLPIVTVKSAQPNLVPIALAIAAFLLFGG